MIHLLRLLGEFNLKVKKKSKKKVESGDSLGNLKGTRLASKDAILSKQFHDPKEARKRPICLVTKYVNGEIADQFYTK
jgi:hypothetical protein